MQFTQRARNIVRAALQSYGTAQMKRSLWNTEFSNGHWKCLDNTLGDCVYPLLEKYARMGTILDLGCGSGSTANELASVYSEYTGVDISDVAIQQAIQKSKANQRENKNKFVQSEILSFIPEKQYDVILFRDSIYYIPLRRVHAALNKYAAYLREEGVFVVRLWGSDKNRPIIETIESTFTIVETYRQDDPKAMILVFR